MAQICENGEYGIKVDKNKALEYYEKVADVEPEAMVSIGSEFYQRNEYGQAVILFEKAAKSGNNTAINNLGT